MSSASDDYFNTDLHLTHGQVIKTEGATAFFNGNANQYNSSQQQASAQTFQYDNHLLNSTSMDSIDFEKRNNFTFENFDGFF